MSKEKVKLIVELDKSYYEWVKDNSNASIAYGLIAKGKIIKDGDAISRDALKKAVNKLFESGGYDSGLVMNTIDTAPTIGKESDNAGQRADT